MLYIVFASLAVLLFSTTMPPMQNPDEAAHSFRADQVSHLGLWSEKLPDGEFGGFVDSGLLALRDRTDTIKFNHFGKITRDIMAPLAWGSLSPAGFPNTAVDPPFFYAPAAVTASIARAAGIKLPHALVLMRLATGLATVAIGAAAVALAGNVAIWFFAVLLLPMSMALSASVSQDGPMIACMALAVSLYLHLRDRRVSDRPWLFAAFCALLTCIGMGRAPYLAFALLVFAVPMQRSWRVIGFSCICVCVIAWNMRNSAYFPLPTRPNGVVAPARQFLGLLGHPWRFPILLMHTLPANDQLIARSFIGQLGWLDVDLPHFYHWAAWLCLALASLASWRPTRIAAGNPFGVEILSLFGAAGGVALVQYMTWTAVGSPIIEGIQGRYFLPTALLFGVFLARPAEPNSSAAAILAVPVLALPMLSIAVTMHALLLRYYY